MKLTISYKIFPYYVGYNMFIQYLSHDHSNRSFTAPTKFCSSTSHICQANMFTLVFLICHKYTTNLQNNNGEHSIEHFLWEFYVVYYLFIIHPWLHYIYTGMCEKELS